MAFEYRIKDQYGQYFVTFTVHQWVDVFTREEYKNILIDSLRFCQKEKGLQIYGWVFMTNHIHLIISSNKEKLSDIIRDFKKYTASKVYAAIQNNQRESRKNWLLWLLRKDDKVWFWEEGYHGEEITTRDFFDSKLQYIHMNPVRAGLVEKEEEYLHSSCGDYYGVRKGLLELAEA
ncbi:MAG: transposase [Imperialibacter sp.]|uniref:REP-associated tyrosine transposase n=1 Tax=Imperialibacter sp. TaxID=2038411 RepID=UPI0032EAC5BD